MNGETPEARLARVERGYAVMEQRVNAAVKELDRLGRMPMQMVRVEGSVEGVKNTLGELRKDVQDSRDESVARAKEHSDERRSLKIALIGLTGVILAALIGGIFLLLASGAHP